MSIATIDDQFVHYEVLGRGEPVILIHGWLGSWRYWWPSMQALATRHRTFAFDLWGFGDSSKVPEQYSMDAYVEMLDKFLNKLGIMRPVTLIGHALGAAVALRYTIRHPERVVRVGAIALPVQGEAINERLLTWDAHSLFSRVVAADFQEVNLELRKTDNVALNDLARELSREGFLEEIGVFPRPLLLIYGGNDPLVKQPTDILPEPNETRAYISLANCQHFPMLEDGLRFNRLILDFTHGNGDLSTIAPKEHWQRRNR